MTAKEVIRILEANGWQRKKAPGGHQYYIHPDHPEKGKVTVAGHSGDLKRKTLMSIARQTGLKF